VVIKRIKDDKKFTDQSLQEVHVLSLLASKGTPSEHNFLLMIDYFYFNVH
jgi:hypothetical protein